MRNLLARLIEDVTRYINVLRVRVLSKLLKLSLDCTALFRTLKIIISFVSFDLSLTDSPDYGVYSHRIFNNEKKSRSEYQTLC